jgi:hypothetical protein
MFLFTNTGNKYSCGDTGRFTIFFCQDLMDENMNRNMQPGRTPDPDARMLPGFPIPRVP